MIHDFGERNAWSLKASDETFWIAVYKRAFPGLIELKLCGDIVKQKLGIDRELYLSNGKVLFVDEKKRSEVWNDILLEYKHVFTNQRVVPGWIEKDLVIDYFAYAFMPTKQVYLFPWEMLKRAWMQNGKAWMKSYPHKISQNWSYNTWNLAVPIPVLQKAIADVSVIDVQDIFQI